MREAEWVSGQPGQDVSGLTITVAPTTSCAISGTVVGSNNTAVGGCVLLCVW
jgi:hypothetical protein